MNMKAFKSMTAKQRRKMNWAPLYLLGPALVLMAMFLIGPLLAVLGLSFTDYQLGAKSFNWIGVENFIELYHDKNFWRSLRNTALYSVVVVPMSVLLGLGVALLIEAQKSFKDFYRTIFFLPVMATLIAMAISWQFILHPTFGFLNLFLKEFGLPGHNWLRTEGLALWVLAAIGIWNQFGFNMVLFLAGLVSIPRHLYDAAAMDGASTALERFRLVTWPLLGPVTLFVVVITTIRSFQVFDTVAILTKGGPSKSTEVLLYTMYAEGFEFFKSGYASAVTVVFLVIVLALTLIKTRYLEKKVHYA
jgi:multiple sugar transport system permease protein